MSTTRPQRWQSMCGRVALNMRLDQMSFQFRMNLIKISQGVCKQYCIGLRKHILRSVHMEFNARSAGLLVPLPVRVINFIEPEKIVHDKVTTENSCFGTPARGYVKPQSDHCMR